jgi:transposase
VLNAILYGAEHGCRWRKLPRRFGRWHVNMRVGRWAKSRVLEHVFEQPHLEQTVRAVLLLPATRKPAEPYRQRGQRTDTTYRTRMALKLQLSSNSTRPLADYSFGKRPVPFVALALFHAPWPIQ